jgi:hypothetical protein
VFIGTQIIFKYKINFSSLLPYTYVAKSTLLQLAVWVAIKKSTTGGKEN